MNTRRTKILHITLAMGAGGLEQLVATLCRSLAAEGAQSSVMVLDLIDPYMARELEEYGIPVIYHPKKARLDPLYYWRAAQIIKKLGIDVIHAHSGCLFDASVFRLLAKRGRLIFTAHGLPVNNSVLEILKDNVASLLADRIVAVSDEIFGIFRDRLPLRRANLITIINGVDTNRFQPVTEDEKKRLRSSMGLPETSVLIGTVGRLDPAKNQAQLLRAFQMLRLEEAHLVVFGEGVLRATLRSLAKDLGIDRQVRFMGVRYGIEDVYPAFDVFALTSTTEGTSVALLEALASGIPAVVTNVGGNSDVVIDGTNGFVVNVDDDRALCDAIRVVLIPANARTLSKNARRRIEESYSLESMLAQYRDLYWDRE